MRAWSQNRSWLGLLLLVGLAMGAPAPAVAETSEAKPEAVQPEEYPVYDLLVRSKFLTSETTLVKIHRLTVTRLGEEEAPLGPDFFIENHDFGGRLPRPLLNEFLAKLRRPARLEPRFHFGARYRLISDQGTDEEEAGVSLAPLPVAFTPVEYDGSMLELEFSRVAFNPWKDQALVYVGNYRADGSGAGFLSLLFLRDGAWEIFDTEVVWTAQPPRRR